MPRTEPSRSISAHTTGNVSDDAVIRGLKIELDLTTEEAEAAWAAATERLGGSA